MNVLEVSRLPSVNGGSLTPGLNAKNHTFTTHDGIVLKIKQVSYGAVRQILLDPTGKPDIPIKKVMYGDPNSPVWGEEAVPTDPVYLEALSAWQTRNNDRMMTYVCATGVDIEVPEEYRAQQAEFFPNHSANEIKYFYVTSLVNGEEIQALMKAITGQSAPSEEGVQQAQAEFQR